MTCRRRQLDVERLGEVVGRDAVCHAALGLALTRSLGEFGATIIVAGNIPGVTRTIPLAIYDYSGAPDGDAMALSLCLVSVAISLAVLILHESLAVRLRRRG